VSRGAEVDLGKKRLQEKRIVVSGKEEGPGRKKKRYDASGTGLSVNEKAAPKIGLFGGEESIICLGDQLVCSQKGKEDRSTGEKETGFFKGD